MKIGNLDVSPEEFETALKVLDVLASELINRLELENGRAITTRSNLYAGFTGGILGWCSLDTYYYFQEVLEKIKLGGGRDGH